MKKSIFLFVTVLLAGAAAFGVLGTRGSFSAAAAAEVSAKREPGIIRVQGAGEVAVEPDTAFVNFGVETAKPDVAAAQTENARKMSQVKKALEDLGIDAGQIQTDRYSVHPQYDYHSGHSKKKGYQVHNTVRVKLTDLENAGKLIDAVTAAGANMFHGIEFSLSDQSGQYHAALKNAMESAREKAQVIAAS
jgi:uncharacterized protein YggE